MTGAVNENVVRNVLGLQKKKKKEEKRRQQALIIWSVRKKKERKRNPGVSSREIEQVGGK